MKNWLKPLLTVLLATPLVVYPEDGDLFQEFDDDAFLSGKESPVDSSGLVGWKLFSSDNGEDTYVINFNEVPMVEYLRFVGRIANINFQFEEAELNFTVTVMADDPLTVPNIVSALIQTLRARGFSVLEQDNNLLITASREINQIANIVTPENKEKHEHSPIVTRVFRIQNANLSTIASILRPMLSQGAILESSVETRQLIITDITTNVDKVGTLIHSLDISHSTLDVEVYKARHMAATELAVLAEQIVKPFAEQNPLIYVPQAETNSIFIVSTPMLLERSVEVMEDLDLEPKDVKGVIGDQVFLYKITNKSAQDLLDAMEEIAEELQGTGAQSIKLISALENARYIKDSNSILFVTDGETQKKVEAIVKILDTFSDARSFYIYKVEKAGKEQVESSLDMLAKSLKRSSSDRDLIDAIHSMRYINETNSFLFTGTDESLKKLRELLPTFDTAVAEFSPSSHYSLYTPKYLSGKELEKAIEQLDDSLNSSGLTDQALLNAIQSMRWVPATNTLLFTGNPASLEHIESIIKVIDVPSGSPNKIFIYKPTYISNEQIEEALDELADRLDPKNLSDRNLAKAIDDMAWIAESQTFLFKADPGTIEKIEGFLKDIDNPQEAESIANAYYLYKLKFALGNDVIEQLDKIAQNLPINDPHQKAITQVIDKSSYLRDSNSILLTGTQKAVEEVKTLISQFDVEGSMPPTFQKTSFFIYKPNNLSPLQLEEALRETAEDLKSSGLVDPALLQSIATMRVVDVTDSVLFTGTGESLKKTKEIIEKVDVASAKTQDLDEFSGESFIVYHVRYMPVDKFLAQFEEVAKGLNNKDDSDYLDVIKAIKSAKLIKGTKKILFTGTPHALDQLKKLLNQFDTLPPEVTQPVQQTNQDLDQDQSTQGDQSQQQPLPQREFVIYKPTHLLGPELIETVKDFESNLQLSDVSDPSLTESINSLRYIERTGYILISGTPQAISQVQELLRKFDVSGRSSGGVTSLTQLETSFLVYKLHYHPGNEIQETLKNIATDLTTANPESGSNLLKAINSLQWIKITNSLLATGSPEVLTQLKELIQNIDVPLRQVFIEVLIIRTTIVNNQQFGLQWGGKVQYLNRFAGGVSNFPAPSPTGSSNTALAPALGAVNAVRTPQATDIPNPVTTTSEGGTSSVPGGFDLGVIGDIILHRGKTFISLASLVNALQSDQDTVIVMNPKIVAQDNQQATIFVGQNIPFTGSNVTTLGVGAQQVQSNIEYRDVGTNLTITPILGTNDIVTLDIQNEITNQVENTTGQGATLQGLQTTRTALNARVHVPNKHFVALSGMISDTKTHFKSGIPCLGGLPVVGAIFSQNDRFNSRDNLIFFIRPVIIDSIEEYDRITHNQECLYKETAVKQVLKEEIDEGIDWVKDADYYCE